MENQISEEVAISELSEFIKHFTRKKLGSEELQEQFPDVIEAVMQGVLVLDKESPKLELIEEITGEGGSSFLKSVNFKTRLLPSDQRKMANGVDLKKDGLLYAHKCMAHIISQPIAILDKLSKVDYKAIEQLSSLFI
jgi:hypothetical protein